MEKVYRRLSASAVPLCFELQVDGLIFPNLPNDEFEDCIVTFNRSGQFENYSLPHPLSYEKVSDDDTSEVQIVAKFDSEKLYMFSTLYSEKGTYHTKYAEIGVFLKRKGAELYTRAGKIKLELNRFGTGKTLELNALFSHKSLDHNIEIEKAMMKFSLTAMSREEAAEVRGSTTVPLSTKELVAETETCPSETSDPSVDTFPGEQARTVVHEGGGEDVYQGRVFCYVFC